jgi:hypothetical protein
MELFKKPQETQDDGRVHAEFFLTVDSGEDPRLKLKRRGIPPNKRRRVRGGGTVSTRNAAGVIEIPDDDPADIEKMYALQQRLIAGQTTLMGNKLRRSRKRR